MRFASSVLAFRLLTHNIRYATESPFEGERPWEERASGLINELRTQTLYNPESFICLQEVLHNQLEDILIGLNVNASSVDDQWAHIGVGRDDGFEAGEYSPILYRPTIWHLEYFKTIWLSETPDRPSKGWDAGSIRILTTGIFRHIRTGQLLVAMCTHLDNAGARSRLESARLIRAEIDRLTRSGYSNGTLPIFLAGDFNSKPDQEAYAILNEASSPVRDLRDMTPQKFRSGHENTFSGFGHDELKRIDFLFLGPKEERFWHVRSYKVLENVYDDGVYISDHRAVVGDVVLD
ncbi:endonuclease/exonuclease/phosphatase family protein [Lineolata rhizophorae]|uniref:Endonuclease/exonuclease/phosphatase family protein n=1 Tax=Lineolata rhizophorae TaxID=578093 RepID=A0A6A6P0X2_9PEZI|nr:endonuclease/exonuclease/phosphatase family protein [Lineolata rhizophorae]